MRTIFSLGLLALSISLAACGGGSSTADNGSTVAKAAFIKQATEVCERHAGALRGQLAQHLESAPAATSEAALYEEIKEQAFVPEVEKELKDLQAVPLPKGGEAEAKKMLQELETGIENLRNQQFRSITDFSPAMDKFDEAAKELGLAPCSFSG